MAHISGVRPTVYQAIAVSGAVTCEAPNNRLHKFSGNLEWNNNTYSIDNQNILLRGCTLRNTEWCFGLVIFAGPDTKLMQNTGIYLCPKVRDFVPKIFKSSFLIFLLILLTLVVTLETFFGRIYWNRVKLKRTVYRSANLVCSVIQRWSFFERASYLSVVLMSFVRLKFCRYV